ncbi:MAG: phosphatidate cytidylyltransferase [Proteobacteria bacterium]|nr:phosphatidate cytidylyltransferase [Pseudomonadota bacterium]
MNRVIPGLVLAVCWLLLLLKGSVTIFVLVLVPILAIGAYEYGKMAFSEQSFFFRLSFALLSILPLLIVFFRPRYGIGGGLCLAFLLLAFWTLAKYGEGFDAYGFFSRASLGLLYIGFLGAHLLLLRELPQGNCWLLILTGITAGSDSGAYYCGRAFGKHKLSPLISPKKTVEGAVGGLLAGMVTSAVLAMFLFASVPWTFLLPVALFLGIVGISGDLTESVLKRATGTKDSGDLLGGHGGILDRGDSLLFAAPVLYYLLLASGTV